MALVAAGSYAAFYPVKGEAVSDAEVAAARAALKQPAAEGHP